MLIQLMNLLLSSISLVTSELAPTHLLVTRAGPCYRNVTSIIKVSTEFSLSTHTYDSLLSGEVNITEDISDGWKIKGTMQKCVDIRNIDTCDFFRSFNLVENGCSDEDDDEQELYSMLFHYANPKLECPVQKGLYRINNYPLFTEDNHLAVHESKISTSVFGYTFRLEGFTAQHRKIFCIEAHLQLLYMREHDWNYNTDIEKTILGPPISDKEDKAQQGEDSE